MTEDPEPTVGGVRADEMVKSIDALSRSQARRLVRALGLGNSRLPLLLPGSARSSVPLAPEETPEDVRPPLTLRQMHVSPKHVSKFAANATVDSLPPGFPLYIRSQLPAACSHTLRLVR